MSDDLRNQIYRNFDQKETNELLGIWKTNNREEWSDQAFEVLEEILKKRNIDLPLQQDLVIENQNEANDEDNLEDWEIKLLELISKMVRIGHTCTWSVTCGSER